MRSVIVNILFMGVMQKVDFRSAIVSILLSMSVIYKIVWKA